MKIHGKSLAKERENELKLIRKIWEENSSIKHIGYYTYIRDPQQTYRPPQTQNDSYKSNKLFTNVTTD
jgi:hypothetical protein